jgi:two-component system response regulator HydG
MFSCVGTAREGQHPAGRVLVVDDDASICELVAAELTPRGFEVTIETNPGRAMETLASSQAEVVVADLRMEAVDGVELCERITAEQPDVPVVLLTGYGTLETAVAALRARAFDFLVKPPDFDALAATLQRAIHHCRLAKEVSLLGAESSEEGAAFEGIIGASPPMRELVQLVNRVASVDAAVMIRGESGTGKELVARALHERSGRHGQFVALNCAAIPASLLEAELFGHVKGAFTDARSDRVGLFERASGGTLFLDEIAELELGLQPKLLRAIQEKAVRPVGGHREVDIDVRLVTATNADLGRAVEQRSFREDLYYRLNVIDIIVPPLRSRGRDILLLAQHFLERSAARMSRPVTGLTASCAARLMAHSWPGNVRELANVVERAVALTRSARLTVDDLPRHLGATSTTRSMLTVAAEELVPLEEVERRYIRRVMAAAGGNKTLAAQILGVDRRTLYRKDWAEKDKDDGTVSKAGP